MRPDDFFDRDDGPNDLSDPLAMWTPPWTIKSDLLDDLRRGPLPQQDDVGVAIGLAELAHRELELYGTSGGERVDSEAMGLVLLALRAVLRRLGIEFEPGFRNLSTFHTYWLGKGAKGSYQARRDLLSERFEPLHQKLIRLEETMYETLADPASPRSGTGWSACRRRGPRAAPPLPLGQHTTGLPGGRDALRRSPRSPGPNRLRPSQAPAGGRDSARPRQDQAASQPVHRGRPTGQFERGAAGTRQQDH
jgi:hypothetical protein